MTIILITILYVATLAFLFVERDKNDKVVVKQFREFVRAIKSETIQEYVETEPSLEEELPVEPEDDFIELGELSPEELLEELNKK